VLENSKGGLGDDKEAWAQSAFESIKNQETYNKVQEFLGGNDPYEFVKSFTSKKAIGPRGYLTDLGLIPLANPQEAITPVK